MISVKKISFLVCMLMIVTGFLNVGAGESLSDSGVKKTHKKAKSNQAQIREVSKEIEKDEKTVRKLEKKLEVATPSHWDRTKQRLESARSYLWKHKKKLIALTIAATAVGLVAYDSMRKKHLTRADVDAWLVSQPHYEDAKKDLRELRNAWYLVDDSFNSGEITGEAYLKEAEKQEAEMAVLKNKYGKELIGTFERLGDAY